MAKNDEEWVFVMEDELNFDDLRSTFIEYMAFLPLKFNDEHVLKAYERVFETIDKLEDKYS